MPVPLQHSDTLFDKFLQDLPDDLQDLARHFKAFTRRRKLQTPQQLLRAVFLYSGLDQSLRQVAATMTLHIGKCITDEAIKQRLAAAKPWLKVLLKQMLALPDEVTFQLQGRRLLVVDASHVAGPGAKTTQFRLHVKMDLLTFEILEILVTDGKESEKLINFAYRSGDIVIGDRGYIRRNRVLEVKEQGVEVIGRFSPTQCLVSDLQGRQILWKEVLSGLAPGQSASLEVQLDDGKGAAQKAWIHFRRKSEMESAQARRKAHRKAQQDRRQVRELTLLLCEYVMVLTTIGPDELSAEVVLMLYRVRWQIEILFKRWKSLLGVSKLRGKQMSELSWSWLYGKLLYCLLIERRSIEKLGEEKSPRVRRQSLWRLWKLVKEEVSGIILGSQKWLADKWKEALKVLEERPRKRNLQSVPEEVLKYIKQELRKRQNGLEVVL
jgi:hypothetical protein